MYLIRYLCPRTDIDLGRHGFAIDIGPDWKKLVAASGLDQEKIDYKLRLDGNTWLDACGYGAMYDPDREYDPFYEAKIREGRAKAHKPGPNTRRMYEARTAIRIQWGEWGCEHISVPGNACGLDIERSSFGSCFRAGVRLCPHNVDCWAQKQLLLIVFTELAEDIVLLGGGV